MNILYVGYWSISEGLSEATIKPHLEVLASMESVKTITYISIERTKQEVTSKWNIPKMTHVAFYSTAKPLLLDKIHDFTILPRQLARLCRGENISKIICRTALAGAIGYLIYKKTKIPYYVESFEPHADYMLESKVWTKYDPRYWIQIYLEKRQKQTSAGLMPVSENYKKKLIIQEKIKCPIEVIPCSVNIADFQFNESHRAKIRKQHNLSSNAVVGIYVGKFGDIYYDEEAFSFFKLCLNSLNDFFLLVLTPQDAQVLRKKFIQAEYPVEKCWYGRIDHCEVSKYLSASDFAFSLPKTSKWSFACSPIKNGEYWANGLPMIISNNIGDDSDIIKNEGGGVVFDYTKQMSSEQFEALSSLIDSYNKDRKNNSSVKNALKYRSNNIVEEIYKNLLSSEIIY